LLNCFDLDKNEARQFKLDRIEEASLISAEV
jgi:predicted DNA-binding transcriptional regulator YafY